MKLPVFFFRTNNLNHIISLGKVEFYQANKTSSFALNLEHTNITENENNYFEIQKITKSPYLEDYFMIQKITTNLYPEWYEKDFLKKQEEPWSIEALVE